MTKYNIGDKNRKSGIVCGFLKKTVKNLLFFG